jgi:hypothetical protein
MKFLLGLSFFLLFLELEFVAQSDTNYFQQEVNYEIHVTLNDERHQLDGKETIWYKNNSKKTLNYIYFHLWPNAYKNHETALTKQLLEENNTMLYFSHDKHLGFIDGLEFKVNGEVAIWTITEENEDVAIVYLPEPLLSGESVEIYTPFSVKLPLGVFSRLGHMEQSYQITQWYPKPAVYDEKGWHQMPYLNQGEFYSEFGTFDVHITLPKNYRVGATGDLINGEAEMKWLDSIANYTATIEEFDTDLSFPESSSETKTLHYHQEKVHDFAWFADKRYHVLKGEVELPNSKEKVTTWAMFTNNEADLWKKSIEYLNDATYYYSLWNGDYPYKHVTAVDGALSAGAGMEYPNVTVIGQSGDAFSLETVIMHEVGHNWFYGILGTNERLHPWMDEGINSFNELRYVKTKYPERLLVGELDDKNEKIFNWFDMASHPHKHQYELAYLLNAKRNKDQPIELAAAEYTSLNYAGIVYSKSAIVFDYLKNYLGEEKFDKCMQRYFQEWKFKHPQPKDLRKIFEEETGENLDWFFDDMIKTTKKIDYKITRNKTDTLGNSLLKIKNNGKINGPFSISGIKDGKIVATQWYEPIAKKAFVSFEKGDYDTYKIDAQKNIPEINRQNNTLKAKGLFKTMEPLRLQWMGSIENPDKTQLFFSPIAGWNNNDKFMMGMAFYNSLIPSKKFEYILAPLYSFSTNEINGYASAFYHIMPNTFIQNMALGASAKSFTRLNYREQELKYYKVNPRIEIDFRKNRARQAKSTFFSYEFVNIFEENTDFSKRDENGKVLYKDTINYFYINNINVGVKSKHPINPYMLKANVQQHQDFVKLNVEAHYSFAYKKPGTGLHFRFFVGRFLYNRDEQQNSRFNYNFSGNEASDYMYNELFLGRNDAVGRFNQQIAIIDGGFRNPVIPESQGQFMQANKWMNSVNVESSLFTKHLSLYADVGMAATLTRDFSGNEVDRVSDFAYNFGVAVNIVPDFFEIYLPITSSGELNQLKYQDKIRFVLNLKLIQPFQLIRKFDM